MTSDTKEPEALAKVLGALYDLSDRIDNLNLRLVALEAKAVWIADRVAVVNERLDRIELALLGRTPSLRSPRPALGVLAEGLRKLADLAQPRPYMPGASMPTTDPASYDRSVASAPLAATSLELRP